MKETLDLKTVKNYFEHLRLFISDLMICIDNIETVINAQSNKINLYPIQEFVGHYVYLSYSHASINIYKIYKQGEKRSFQKLFNKFKNFRYSDDLKNLLSENASQDDENLIKNKSDMLEAIEELEIQIAKNDDLITKINTRRETFYAHTDPDISIQSETLAELKEINELSKSVYNNLYGKLFSSYFMFYNHASLISPVIEDRKFVDEFWRKEEDKLK